MQHSTTSTYQVAACVGQPRVQSAAPPAGFVLHPHSNTKGSALEAAAPHVPALMAQCTKT